MAYCTEADLIRRYGETELLQLADREQTGAIDAEVLAEVIGAADAEIDEYVGQVQSVPLTAPAAKVVNISIVLTYWNLMIQAGAEAKPEAAWVVAAKRARQWLADVAARRLRLDASAAPGDPVVIESGGRLWDRGSSGGFL